MQRKQDQEGPTQDQLRDGKGVGWMNRSHGVTEWLQIRREEPSVWSLGLQCQVRVRPSCVFSPGASTGVQVIMDGCLANQECGDLRFCWFYPYPTGNRPLETQHWLIERNFFLYSHRNFAEKFPAQSSLKLF